VGLLQGDCPSSDQNRVQSCLQVVSASARINSWWRRTGLFSDRGLLYLLDEDIFPSAVHKQLDRVGLTVEEEREHVLRRFREEFAAALRNLARCENVRRGRNSARGPQAFVILPIPSCTNFLQHGRIDDPFSERID
jgi:hypothetical protein